MKRALIAMAVTLACGTAAWAQQDLPPETDPLAPTGPREFDPGQEGIEFNVTAPAWIGVRFRGSFQRGGGKMDTARGKVVEDFGGARPPLTVTLEYEEMEFEAVGFGVVSDYDLFQVSIDVAFGDFEGDAVLGVDDGVVPPTFQDVEVEGDFFSFKVGVFMPVLQARAGGFHASLGPVVSAGLHLSEPEPPSEAPLVLDDDVSELIGTAGVRLNVRMIFSGFYLSLEAETAYMFSSTRGLMEEASFGAGFRF